MYIQTDDTGKVVGAIDQEWLDSLPEEEKETAVEGFVEVDAEDVFREGYDTYYLNGELAFVENNEAALQRIAELKASLKDTDYIAAKLTDRLADCTSLESLLSVTAEFNAEYADTLKQRQEWRNEINELETKVR